MNNNNSATIQGRCYNNVKRPDFTPESISSLNPDEVFVFGSNLQGHHGGGAAYFAMKRFGAIWGQGVGLQGQSYAIPTMQGGIDTIKPYVEQFIAFAKEHREFFFYVTRIGCGIAGFKDSEIAPLFETSLDVENICLPKQFVTALQETRQEPQEVPAELLTLMHGQIRTLIDLLKDLNKQQPIKDCKDAYTRLTELVERNIRYGDEYAFMALRTIWCIMSQQEQEGHNVDIDLLEKELFSFHKTDALFENSTRKILYDYSASKIIKYIQFLNEFRKYKNYEEVREDLHTIHFSHCSENDPHYYFSFYRGLFYEIEHILLLEWENITIEGKLDNKLLDDVIFGRYEGLIKKYGLKETIRLAYTDIGCHPDLKASGFSDENGWIYGPNYKIDGAFIEKGCSDFRRWPWSNTSFEMRFAHVILDRDENYEKYPECYGGGFLYIPVTDYSLPVYSSRRGKLRFDSQEEKIRFIKNAGGSC